MLHYHHFTLLRALNLDLNHMLQLLQFLFFKINLNVDNKEPETISFWMDFIYLPTLYCSDSSVCEGPAVI